MKLNNFLARACLLLLLACLTFTAMVLASMVPQNRASGPNKFAGPNTFAQGGGYSDPGNLQYVSPWDVQRDFSTSTASYGTSPQYIVFQAKSTIAINKLTFNMSTTGVGANGARWAIADSTGPLSNVLCKTNVYTGTTTSASDSVSFPSTCTLSAGTYFLLFGTASGSAVFTKFGDETNFSAYLNFNAARMGFCTNNMTGTGGSLDFPATCGGTNTYTPQPPLAILEH